MDTDSAGRRDRRLARARVERMPTGGMFLALAVAMIPSFFMKRKSFSRRNQN